MICFRKALRIAVPLLLMIGILTGLPMPVAAANMDITAQEVVDDMTIGWNLGNALDCYESPEFGVDGMASEELWGNPPIQKELLDSVHEAGYDAVRLPVTWYNHMDPETYEIDPEWMARVRTVVDYILADDMYCILNVHHDTGEKGFLRANPSNYKENKDIFVSMWQQICDEFQDYDEKLLFEGFNEMLDENNVWDEPSDVNLLTLNAWNQLFVDTVRATGGNNPKRILVVKTYCASSAYKTLNAFKIPDDPAGLNKIIASTHIYRPMDFTNEHYPEITKWSEYELDPHVGRMYDFFVKYKTPLIIEEFGCVDKDNLKERMSWSEYYVTKFRDMGVVCFWWDNGNEYKLFDRTKNLPAEPQLIGTMVSAARGETYHRDYLGELWAALKIEFSREQVAAWIPLAVICMGFLIVILLLYILNNSISRRKYPTYADLHPEQKKSPYPKIAYVLLLLSYLAQFLYLAWRIRYSLPLQSGILAIVASSVLLLVELLGAVETVIHYRNIIGARKYDLPEIADDEYPEVDIFIATYNEPCDLLRRTINGCKHIDYPDKSKVHIWVCDDNRRKEMRALAEKMGVGYFDRPNNEGAKAGNLNAAMARTSAPYIVTLDADMIPRSDFLLKTIPYFVENRKQGKTRLGFIQTPQCFYDPDVFQHALYSEYTTPNEQNFFYHTIEPARTSTNSVIYGGSNTILAREALEAIGGFYTKSITEDFATGLLIESEGFCTLGLPEPLASGRTPHDYKEHIQQRTRWGRGVIVTAKQLKIFRRKGLTLAQKLSYWGSVTYWYSPIKTLIYLLSPLLFAVAHIPVFYTSIAELIVYWLPMFLLQDICLRLFSGNSMSTKWSGIYETSVMPHLLLPILKESVGISMSKFKVTDKSGAKRARSHDLRTAIPFIILIVLSLAGIGRVVYDCFNGQLISSLVILFWLIRNMYFLVMSLFLINGRDSSGEPVEVVDALPVSLQKQDGTTADGITTRMYEHSLLSYMDDGAAFSIGDTAKIKITGKNGDVDLGVIVTGVRTSRFNESAVLTMEILDFGENQDEYFHILFDRIPSMPMHFNRDLGLVAGLWRNIVARIRLK